jgi:hypothetical protein
MQTTLISEREIKKETIDDATNSKSTRKRKEVFTQIGLHHTFGFRFLQLRKNMVIS